MKRSRKRRVSLSMNPEELIWLRWLMAQLRRGVVDARVVMQRGAALHAQRIITKAAARADEAIKSPLPYKIRQRNLRAKCAHGHEWTQETTGNGRVSPVDGIRYRKCLACKMNRERRRRTKVVEHAEAAE